MQEERRRSGRTERGCNLARNQTALAHSGNHDARTAAIQQLDSLREGLRHRTGNAIGKLAESFRLHSNDIGTNSVHEVTMLSNVRVAPLVRHQYDTDSQ
jgi:hypothetical protein